MSQRPPTLTAAKLLAILGRHGFVQVRQRGCHVIMEHSDGRSVTVPVHQGRDIGRGLLLQIMRDAGLTVEDLRGR